jgi:predicted NBD/HSP70 family sugar kinase
MSDVSSVKAVYDQRDAGRLQVLDTIRSAGQIARIDIAQATGFSPATVTAITSEMISAGLIEEAPGEPKATENRRGRPRVTLKLRGEAHRIAGLKVARGTISVVIVDFEGNEIAEYERTYEEARVAPEVLAEQIRETVYQACLRAGCGLEDLSGLGIGMAGQVDSTSNYVHWSSSLTRRNVGLGAYLADVLPCPVFIDNDANLVAKAEHLFGSAGHAKNFLVVTVEYGIGLGIVIDGEVYRGARGCGAEFGHTKVQLNGALCQCGQRGCLEAYVGTYALLREASAIDDGKAYPDVMALYQAAQSGNQMAKSILDRAGSFFSLGIANLINLFDPELIIIAGRSHIFPHLQLDEVVENAWKSVIQVDASAPEILLHGWGDLMWAKGAAAYAIERVSALTVRELGRDAS